MNARLRFKQTFWTCALGLLFAFLLFAWWNSSRYSERHLVYVGPGTIEIFSSSSLLRVSLVPGRVGHLGSKTFYRQKNARGKMLLRPVFPKFHQRSGLREMTLGYWHLAMIALIAWVMTAFAELSALRLQKTGAEGRN